MSDAEDTLIGYWDPYVASIVESTQEQAAPANPARVSPAPRTDSPSDSICRRARLLSGKYD